VNESRSRPAYALCIALVVLAGLASRSGLANHLPPFLATYAGDTLWALMVFLILGFLFPKARTRTIALATIAFSFAIEFSQLYQAGWINAIRHTRIGALVLGFGFLWSDLLCYTAGCALGAAGEFLSKRRQKRGRISVESETP
jgi:glycopeptide antibiotics resistance protein